MHSITKPDTTGAINVYTEDLHCITCHKPRTEHNGTVNCTICHSQDAHKIMFFNGTGYLNQGKANTGNCTTCHQDGIWDTLLNCSNVSTYDGSSAPSLPKPLNHSDNTSAGQCWGTYWTDDLSACEYCHSDTYHLSNALGRLSYWNGNNTINSSLNSNSTWCAGCHYISYSSGSENYTHMVNKFSSDGLSIPPEITSGAYAPNTTTGFYEHVFTDNYSDRLCRECHEKKVNISSNITSLMHSLTEGDCENCHYDAVFMINRGKSDKFVNSTMYEASVHGNRTNIWCWDCHLTSNHPDPEYYWKWCECCHSYQTNPVVDRDRHNVTNTPSAYLVGGTDVLNITDCTACHDAAKYNSAVNNATQNCRYCHDIPDKGNKTTQNWY
jgi:Zn finger protein HypA/HybF involved in hydrogenase expression